VQAFTWRGKGDVRALFEFGSGVLFPDGVGAGEGEALGSWAEEGAAAEDSLARVGWVASDMIDLQGGLAGTQSRRGIRARERYRSGTTIMQD